MSEEKLRRVYDMYCDCWHFFKRNAMTETTDDSFWEQVIDEGYELLRKYENDPLARGLIIETQKGIVSVARRNEEGKNHMKGGETVAKSEV